MNMSRMETMNTRYGEFLDLMSCMAIKKGAKPRKKSRHMSIFEALALE